MSRRVEFDADLDSGFPVVVEAWISGPDPSVGIYWPTVDELIAKVEGQKGLVCLSQNERDRFVRKALENHAN